MASSYNTIKPLSPAVMLMHQMNQAAAVFEITVHLPPVQGEVNGQQLIRFVRGNVIEDQGGVI
ncbi:MAG: hypothetical protein ACR2IS_06490 [Nitrososphaeraceae archaeon]